MNYYFDIQIKYDNVLLNKVYTKFHKALYGKKTIGISFPKYKITLGNILRVHGKAEELIDFLQKNWLHELKQNCKISQIKKIPSNVQYRIISRKHKKMMKSKLNRLIKRGTIPKNEINLYKEKMFKQGLTDPYLELKSGSNGYKYRRFIKFGELLKDPIIGEFDYFGLSKDATIPWF